MNTTTEKRCFLNVREGDMITTYVFDGYAGLAQAAAMKGSLMAEGIKSTISTKVDEVFTNPQLN